MKVVKGKKNLESEEHNSLVETNYLLSRKNGEILLRSIAELKEGNKVHHPLLDK